MNENSCVFVYHLLVVLFSRVFPLPFNESPNLFYRILCVQIQCFQAHPQWKKCDNTYSKTLSQNTDIARNYLSSNDVWTSQQQSCFPFTVSGHSLGERTMTREICRAELCDKYTLEPCRGWPDRSGLSNN